MDTRIIVVIIVSVLFIVIFWLSLKKSKSRSPINLLPTPIPTTDEQEYKMLQLYLEEWRETISTQMHFNDLILRFRSVILTAFVTLIGAAFAVQKFAKLQKQDILLVFSLPIILWLTAFIIDFFYYHRMLLGSVAQALKFDESEKLRSCGLFGMTKCISEHIHPSTSKILVFLYYFAPLIAIIVLLCWGFQWPTN